MYSGALGCALVLDLRLGAIVAYAKAFTCLSRPGRGSAPSSVLTMGEPCFDFRAEHAMSPAFPRIRTHTTASGVSSLQTLRNSSRWQVGEYYFLSPPVSGSGSHLQPYLQDIDSCSRGRKLWILRFHCYHTEATWVPIPLRLSKRGFCCCRISFRSRRCLTSCWRTPPHWMSASTGRRSIWPS